MPKVGIIVGSTSDQPVMEDTLKTLTDLGVDAELVAISAHRNPDKVREWVRGAESRGIEVIIAAAGGAAALPGVVASHTTLPVIGVPLTSSDLNGVHSLHSIVMMPPGIPVATVALGAWGARNSALLAAQVLGLKYANIRVAVEEYRERLRER